MKRVLVLSIRSVHADRIFQGTKTFELRKRLPQAAIDRVFLYESGGGGIVGCFDAGEIISAPIDQLWQEVGEGAATQERFYKYFAGRLIGFAIKIKNPLQFAKPILPKELARRAPEFTAPMSFLVLKEEDRLFSILQRKAKSETRASRVALVPITRPRRRRYIDIVTRVISNRYDEITPGFAKAALKSHDAGSDSNGLFTLRKEVFEIRRENTLIGFTTLTFKFSGSVKTGPTILFPQYQGKGYGLATRDAIEAHVRALGVRKLYCTCPDSDGTVIAYLLRSGYSVEAHLRSHYRVENGEFVFGKLLASSRFTTISEPKLDSECRVVDADEISLEKLSKGLHRCLALGGFPVTKEMAKTIAKNSRRSDISNYEEKPFDVLALLAGDRVQGVALCIPKRGGATKVVLGLNTSAPKTINGLMERIEMNIRNAARRKIFVLLPIGSRAIHSVLSARGFETEGLLRQPYMAGVDCVVLGRFV